LRDATPDETTALMDRLARANDVGLFSEEIDRRRLSGQTTGARHLALVDAAIAISAGGASCCPRALGGGSAHWP
jgi:GH15 family glucan-1,4-alpha-glucosidase